MKVIRNRWSTCILAAVTFVTLVFFRTKSAFSQTSTSEEQVRYLDDAQAIGASGQSAIQQSNTLQGIKVRALATTTVPTMTEAQRQEFEALTARSNRTGPLGSTAVAPPVKDPGPEVVSPALRSAAGDFSIYSNTVIPSSGIAGGYGSSSYTGEPSLGFNGKNRFQTGNWYATRSYNNGATWSYLNPYTLFGPGFCCDQVTLYDAGRNRQFWLLQFSNHLVLANSAGTDLSGWCYWNITPAWFGLPSNTEFDYNDIALSKNFIYLTTNLFTGASGSLIARFPIDPQTTCSGFGYSWITRSDSFTFKPVQGAQNVIYWGSNWGQTNGSSFRIYSWAENSGTYFWYDRTISPFTFMYRNSGQNCGSRNGVVTNWCQFADSRVLGGYLSENVDPTQGIIGFSWNAKQDASFPFPYTYRVYFRESDKAYLGRTNLWGSWGAIQFLSLAPNSRGNLGGSFAWGGGTGTTAYYPGWGLLIDDDFSPNQPWAIYYIRWGAGNTCTYGGLYRWGDYLTARPYYPVGDVWTAAGFTIQGGNCGSFGSYTEPRNAIFGRGRDAQSVYRWWGN